MRVLCLQLALFASTAHVIVSAVASRGHWQSSYKRLSSNRNRKSSRRRPRKANVVAIFVIVAIAAGAGAKQVQ